MLVSSFLKISPWVTALLRKHDFHTEIYQGASFRKKTVDGDMVIVLSILSYDALYLYQVL